MPYIIEETKEPVKVRGAMTGGDLNFLITEVFQQHFVDLECRYKAIHSIRKIVKFFHKSTDFQPVEKYLNIKEYDVITKLLIINDNKAPELTSLDMEAAIDAALDEFNRRITGPYEDQCIQKNGDVMHPALSTFRRESNVS